MNPPELIQLAAKARLDSDDHFDLRVRFGVACIERVEHVLTDNDVVKTLLIGKDYVSGECGVTDLKKAAIRASELASSHAGSGSIDGAGSGAVSTSRGVAAALAGRALQAAGYAAYVSVYTYASYAVTDQSAFESEFAWQISKLNSLTEHIIAESR